VLYRVHAFQNYLKWQLNLVCNFTTFCHQGMPTHDASGKELSKGQLKKLTKLYEAQEKKHREYTASLEQGDSAMKN